ncbi:MAG: hypothetical protein HY722_00280 [Planctomycetes bacterium]|nr:hypothetical protein [Planctomycetota bacterium]
MLVVVMGVLTLVSVFAVAFSVTVSVESSAASAFVDTVRARFLAQAGFNRAAVELTNLLIERSRAVQAQRVANPLLAGDVSSYDSIDDRWVYPDRGLRLAETLRPSFLAGEFQGTERRVVHSGSLGGTLTAGGDVYALKVIDCAGMIHLNMADRQILGGMIRVLCRELGDSAGADPVRTAVMGDTDRIVTRLADLRPAGGYRSRLDLRGALRSEFANERLASGDLLKSEAYAGLLGDYLTAFGWVDGSTLRPPRARFGGSGTEVMDMRLALEPRAPVNVNTAPREVLVAVLEGIHARDGSRWDVSLDQAAAEGLAQAIVDRRLDPGSGTSRPFKGWKDFYGFVDTVQIAPGGTGSPRPLSQEERALVKVHANSNADVDEFFHDGYYLRADGSTSPLDENLLVRRFVKGGLVLAMDRTDLVSYTTEFCFHSMGVFELSSLGMVLDPQGRVVAEGEYYSVVRIFETWRDSSQNDFEYGRMPVNAIVRRDVGGAVQEVHFGVASVPEYSNERGRDAPFAPLSPPARYDGQLVLNGLVSQVVKPRDFLLGFVRGTLKAHPLPARRTDLNEPLGSGRPHATRPNRAVDARAVEGTGVPGVDTAALFHGEGASDLMHDGVVFHEGLRGLGYLEYSNGSSADAKSGNVNVRLDSGTIELWVKPLWDLDSAGGVLKPVQETYFYWGRRLQPKAPDWFSQFNDPTMAAGVSAKLSAMEEENSIEIFRRKELNGQDYVYARVAFKGPKVGLATAPVAHDSGDTIRVKVTGWKPREWHHITLVYGKHDNAAGNGRMGSARLFVDGQMSVINVFPTQIRTWIDWSIPAIRQFMEPLSFDDNPRVAPVNDTVLVGAGRAPYEQEVTLAAGSTVFDPEFMYVGTPTGGEIRDHCTAILDNVFGHHYIRQVTISAQRYLPRSRYFDQSISTAAGPNDNTRGLYRRRLQPMEGRPFVMGGTDWTEWHDGFLGEGFGVEVYTGRGRRLLPGEHAEKSDAVYYNVNVANASNRWPINATPYLDDVTLTFFTGPRVLYTSDVLE